MDAATPPPLIKYHQTAPLKFVILSILTFGLYGLYWCYKCWKYVKTAEGRSDIMPFWRALFSPLWVYALFATIFKGEQHLLGVVVAVSYFLIHLCDNLPEPYNWFSVLSFLPLLVLVVKVNKLNQSVKSKTYWRFGWKHWATVGASAVIWALVFYGTTSTMPSKWTKTDYGFSVDLRGAEWGKWDDLADNFEFGLFGTLGEPDTALVVVGADWPQDLHLNQDSIVRGLFALIGYEQSDFELLKESQEDSGDGYLIYGMEDDYLFRFKILIQEHRAYLTGSWSSLKGTEEAARLIQDINRMEIEDADRDAASDYLGYSKFLNHAGLACYDKEEYQQAERLFSLAFQVNPKELVYLGNALSTLIQLEDYDLALERLDSHAALVEQDISLLDKKGELLDEMGQVAQAYEVYRKRAKMKPDDSEVLMEFLYYSINTDQTEQTVEHVQEFTQISSHNVDARVLWAEILETSEGVEKAIAYLTELAQLDQNAHDECQLMKLEILYRDEQFKQSLNIAETMIKAGVRPLLYLQWKGDCQMALEWYADAKKSFEQSLKYDEDNRYSLDSIEKLKGLLGQGSNDLAREPIEAVELPDWIKIPELTPEKLAELGADEDMVYACDSQAMYYRAGEKIRRTFHYEVVPLTEKGLRSLSTFKFSFDPLYERVFVNKLEILDSKDEIVATGDLDNFYVIDDTSDGMADTDKVLHLPVPALDIGLKLHLVVTKESLSNQDEVSFRRFYFNNSYPTLWSGFYLDAKAETWKKFASQSVLTQSVDDQHIWYSVEPAKLDFERNMPFYEDVYAYLYIGQAESAWEELVESYYEDILLPQLETSDEVKAHVNSLIGEEDSQQVKLQKIVSDVQRSIRYEAIEFGVRGLKPNRADKTRELRYGDCKDHSVLLHGMLKEAGITSSVVLVNTEDRIQQEVPSMNQFNHMIVKAETEKGAVFVDATAKFLKAWELSPNHLLRRWALEVGAEMEWHQIQPAAARHENVYSDKSVKLKGKNIEVKEVIRLSGYFAENFRSWLNGIEVKERKNRIQGMLRTTGQLVALKKLSISNEDNFDQPLEFVMKYTLPQSSQEIDGQLYVSVPALWERYYLEMDEEDHRQHSYIQDYPYNFYSSLKVAGASYDSVKKAKKVNGIFDYKHESTEDGKTGVARFTASQESVAGYEVTRKGIREYLMALEKKILIDEQQNE